MYVLVVYVPKNALNKVKNALFSAGAGKYGLYDECAFMTRGKGQFRPLDGARPFIGKIGAVKKVREYRMEVIIDGEDKIEGVIKALLASHPYQTPSYHIYNTISSLEDLKFIRDF